jgi:hypothetical protein
MSASLSGSAAGNSRGCPSIRKLPKGPLRGKPLITANARSANQFDKLMAFSGPDLLENKKFTDTHNPEPSPCANPPHLQNPSPTLECGGLTPLWFERTVIAALIQSAVRSTRSRQASRRTPKS